MVGVGDNRFVYTLEDLVRLPKLDVVSCRKARI